MRWHRNVWVVTATSLLTDISSEMIVHLLPLFLRSVLGAPVALIGLLDGIAETVSAVVKIVAGRASDRFRSRKWFAVAGYAVSAAAKPFLLLTQTWFGVLGVRFADRVGKGLRNPPRDALLAASVDGDRRGAAFGLHRAGDTAGAFVGIGVAVWIVSELAGGITLTADVFHTVVLVSIIPAVLAVGIMAVGAREVASPRTAHDSRLVQRTVPVRSFVSLPAAYRRFVGIIVVFTLGNATDAFIVLRAQSLGMSLVETLLLMLLMTATYSVSALPLGTISDRYGRRRVLIAGWLLYAVVYAALAVAWASWQLWIACALYGVYYGATEGVARAYVADVVDDQHRATAYGFYQAAVAVAILPASAGAGLLWDAMGPALPFAVGAVLTLCAAMMLAVSGRQRS